MNKFLRQILETSRNANKKVGLIAGSVVGGIAFLCIVIGNVVCAVRCCKKRRAARGIVSMYSSYYLFRHRHIYKPMHTSAQPFLKHQETFQQMINFLVSIFFSSSNLTMDTN